MDSCRASQNRTGGRTWELWCNTNIPRHQDDRLWSGWGLWVQLMKSIWMHAAEQRLSEARIELRISGGVALVALLSLLFGFPKTSIGLFVVSAWFLLGVRGCHVEARRLLAPRPAFDRHDEPVEARLVSLGGGEVLEIRCSEPTCADRAMMERIARHIEGDPGAYAASRDRMLAEAVAAYPDWADYIVAARVEAILIYTSEPELVAIVEFEGDAGAFFHADYAENGFSYFYVK